MHTRFLIACALAPLGLIILVACQTTAPAPRPAAICPPLKPYTADQEAALGASIDRLQSDDPIVMALADYGAMRAAARACQAAVTPKPPS